MSGLAQHLQKKSIEITLNAEYITERINDFTTIKQFMKNRIAGAIMLNEAQEIQLKRYQFIYDQRSTGKHSELDIMGMLTNMFKVSEGQARIDLKNAKELFANTMQFNKQFEIMMDMKVLDMLKQKAIAVNNLDAFSKLQKQKTELLKLMPDEQDTSMADFEPIKIVYADNPELLGRSRIPIARIEALVNQLKTEHGISNFDFNPNFFEDAEIIEENENSTSASK